ncbi:unnamed protein product [Lactuca virosa]|uniref:Secreted protein n=1 Tax=Lactuca virosa TaxID=75947 RepID=A0AAU9MFY4_9ASTR|nr:unnamed protein product [Lactuca virosa]
MKNIWSPVCGFLIGALHTHRRRLPSSLKRTPHSRPPLPPSAFSSPRSPLLTCSESTKGETEPPVVRFVLPLTDASSSFPTSSGGIIAFSHKRVNT